MRQNGRPVGLADSNQTPPLSGELIDLRHEEAHDYGRQYPPLPKTSGRWDRRQRWALGLFIATCLSTWAVGGIAYAAAVMFILVAHEMGHYLQARRYHVPASLPYFIPMPLTPLGTMGAVIVQGRGSADRKQMFDIAISGPLAGLVVALPVMYFGLLNSTVKAIPDNFNGIVYGDPLIIKWMAASIHGTLPPGHDIVISPLGFAGWVGILVTALNLIPIGQLDGGHILYTLIGKRAHVVAMGILGGAVIYMFATNNVAYSLMIVLLMLMGPRHPPTRDDSVPLGKFRIILGWLTLAFIIIGFTPRPIMQIPG